MRAIAPLAQCFTLSEELGDERRMVVPSYFMGWAMFDENPGKSLEFFDRAIELARRYEDKDIEALAWSSKAWASARLGHFQKAQSAVESAQDLLKDVKSPMASSDVDLYAGWTFLEMGDTTHGLEFGQRGLEKARAADNWDCVCGGYLCVGFSYLSEQNLTQAENAFRDAITKSEFTGTEVFENMGRAGLALTRFYGGDKRAVEDLERAYTRGLGMQEPMVQAIIAQGLGQVLSQQGKSERAIELYEQALAYLRPNEIKPALVRTYQALTSLYAQTSRPEQAQNAQREADYWAQELVRERESLMHESQYSTR
jgi:hypothetical protein